MTFIVQIHFFFFRDQRFDDHLVSFIAKKADLLFTKPQRYPDLNLFDDDSKSSYVRFVMVFDEINHSMILIAVSVIGLGQRDA